MRSTTSLSSGLVAAAAVAKCCLSSSTEAFVARPHQVVATTSTETTTLYRLEARRRRDEDDYYYDDDEVERDGYYYDDDENRRSRRRRRSPNLNPIDDLGARSPSPFGSDDDTSLGLPSAFGRRSGLRLPDSVSKALLAGVFVLGIGTGVTVDSQINTNPKDLASRDAIDQAAPNPTLCTTYGASAMAFDQRVFVSFNPFNVYVSQVDVKPACVLRPANVVPILRDRKLLNDDEVRSCKRNMNTWAFVGDLNDQPQLSCVYQSEDAQNEFLSNPKLGIGEDYLDDDREKMVASTKKTVKDKMTKGQRKKMAADNAAVGSTNRQGNEGLEQSWQ